MERMGDDPFFLFFIDTMLKKNGMSFKKNVIFCATYSAT